MTSWQYNAFCDTGGKRRFFEPSSKAIANAVSQLDGESTTLVVITADNGEEELWLTVFGGTEGLVACSISTPTKRVVEHWLVDPEAGETEEARSLPLEGAETVVPGNRCVPVALATQAARDFLRSPRPSPELHWDLVS